MNWKAYLGIFIFILSTGQLYNQSTLQYSSLADLKAQILNDKEHITVLNFWATWCRPCVAELPEFEKVYADFKASKVNMILANLDFHSKADSLVPAFIQKHHLQSQVVHITDQDPNEWIDQVDISWTGSIPVTAIYYKGEKVWFFEGSTDYETLKSIIIKYIQQ